jgi:hypothetical protein
MVKPPEFQPETLVRDYGHFTLDLSALDKALVARGGRFTWLQLRNAMLDRMVITEHPDATIDVKWITLLNFVQDQLRDPTMPPHSALCGTELVEGMGERLVAALGLGNETILTGMLLDTGHAPRAQLLPEREIGPSLARSREARKRTAPLSDLPPSQERENPYGRVNRLIQEIRTDIPDDGRGGR